MELRRGSVVKNDPKTYTLSMTSSPQPLPSGFVEVGTLSADGVQFTPDSEPPYSLEPYGEAREARFDITLEGQNPELICHLFGMKLEDVKPVRWYSRLWRSLKRKVKR